VKKKNKLRWSPAASVTENAAGSLPRVVRRYFAAGRNMTGGKPSGRKLHQLRLETKRFRYTLELFRPVYGPRLEHRLGLVRQIQQILGDMNDCVATIELVSAGEQIHQPEVAQWIEKLKRRAGKKEREFLRFWANTFDAPGEEQRWIQYMSRGLRRPPRAIARRPARRER
jgi:CHAD domain-containing protein